MKRKTQFLRKSRAMRWGISAVRDIGKRFLATLASKEFPYLATVMIGALGWVTTHTADRILAFPTIEYKLIQENRPDGDIAITYEITNVSKDRAYEKLMFMIAPAEGTEFIGEPSVVQFSPMFNQEELEKADGEAGYLNYSVPQFHPGWNFQIEALVRGDGTQRAPTLAVSTEIWNPTAQPVRLVRPSLETFVFRHELNILIVLAALWLGILVSVFAARKP